MPILTCFKISGLKKKQQHSDSEDDNEQQGKSSELRRRAQVFAKPQEESTGIQNIKSMFAANKTRNIQRQEQVSHLRCIVTKAYFLFLQLRIKEMNQINYFPISCSNCKSLN